MNLYIYNNNLNYLENRNEKDCPPPKAPIPPVCKSGPNKIKSLDFKQIKKNTIRSLNEVEYFLNNFNRALTCLKLYKIFK